jgi:16S rRNA (uracil1498-N3)-methyltransferase
MAAPRFYIALDLVPAMVGEIVDLPDEVAHHAVRVVRLSMGESLTLFTGAGGEFAATLTRIDKRGAAVRLDAFDPVERESPLAVTLAQAIAANDAMDYAVRKAVELGVAAIQPVVTARSAAPGSGERALRRLAHWRQIAIAACEQCARNRIPEIAPPRSLTDWLAAWHEGGLVLAPDAAESLPSLPKPTSPLALLVGPEGGFEQTEVDAAREQRLVAVRLGPRVLRTETAGVATLAAMQTLWGDLR